MCGNGQRGRLLGVGGRPTGAGCAPGALEVGHGQIPAFRARAFRCHFERERLVAEHVGHHHGANLARVRVVGEAQVREPHVSGQGVTRGRRRLPRRRSSWRAESRAPSHRVGRLPERSSRSDSRACRRGSPRPRPTSRGRCSSRR